METVENSERHRTGPASPRYGVFQALCERWKNNCEHLPVLLQNNCFSTVCIVRQFPRPAFDWRHLPIYRMNHLFHLLRPGLPGGGPLHHGPARASPQGFLNRTGTEHVPSPSLQDAALTSGPLEGQVDHDCRSRAVKISARKRYMSLAAVKADREIVEVDLSSMLRQHPSL